MTLSKAAQRIRATGYGSSEVATICGLNRWESPIKVYERKVLEESGGRAGVAADLGTLLEEPVAQLYARRTGKHLRLVKTLAHPTRSIVKATPDRAVFTAEPPIAKRVKLELEQLAGADRLLEVKTVDERDRRFYGEPLSDLVPEDKLAQVTWQMGATAGRVNVTDLAVLFGRRSWEIFTVKLNLDLFEGLFDMVARFDRDHVQARKPPPVDGSEAYREYLARTYPQPLKPQLLASDEDEPAMLDFMKLKAMKKRIDAVLDREGNKLRARIGDARGLASSKIGEVNLLFNRGKTPIDYEAAFKELHQISCLIVNSMPSAAGREQLGAQIRACLDRHTSEPKPYRYFQLKPVKGGPADFELQRLEVVLDKLEAAAGEGPTVAQAEEVDPSSQSTP